VGRAEKIVSVHSAVLDPTWATSDASVVPAGCKMRLVVALALRLIVQPSSLPRRITTNNILVAKECVPRSGPIV